MPRVAVLAVDGHEFLRQHDAMLAMPRAEPRAAID